MFTARPPQPQGVAAMVPSSTSMEDRLHLPHSQSLSLSIVVIRVMSIASVRLGPLPGTRPFDPWRPQADQRRPRDRLRSFMLSFLRQAAPRQQVGVQTIRIHVTMTLSVTAQR
jgi:hypothetical protein